MSEPTAPAGSSTGSAGGGDARDHLRILVVSRWLPAYDGAVRGSFVADQLAALAADPGIELRAASFEFAHLSRLPERQGAEREALQLRTAAALHTRADSATPGGWLRTSTAWSTAAEIPVARLPVAHAPQDPTVQEADDHVAALLPFAEGPACWSGDFDLVHAHTGFPDGVAAAAVASRAGVPLFITEHASRTPALLEDPDVRPRYLAALEQATRVIAVSRALAEELLAALPEARDWLPDRIVVIPNAVPLALFRAPSRAARVRDEILYVGSRKPDKGMATLLAAFARLHADRPTATLRLIGPATDEDESRWRSLAGELGILPVVAFEPAADRSAVADAMARADVFVHPSHRETFGMVGVEALASGLPVVATRSGGLDEILGPDPDRLGALVPVEDAPALADALLRVLERRDGFDPLALRAAVADRYAAPAVALRLGALYRSFAGGAARGARAPEGSRATAGSGGTTAPGAVVVPGAAEPDGVPAAAAAMSGPEAVAAAAGTSAPGTSATRAPAPVASAPVADRSLPLLVIAFNRVRAARALARLPASLRARITLVTTLDDRGPTLPSDLGGLLELDLDVDYRAALETARPAAPPRGLLSKASRFLRDPGATERIAGIHAARGEYRLGAARRLIAGELRRRAGTVGVPSARAAVGQAAAAATGAVAAAEHATVEPGAVAPGVPGHAAAEPAAQLPDILCLDGYDVLAAEEAIDAGLARLAPGGMRWLADRWAAGEGAGG